MGVLHSSFLPEHHDTQGMTQITIYFLKKVILNIELVHIIIQEANKQTDQTSIFLLYSMMMMQMKG